MANGLLANHSINSSSFLMTTLTTGESFFHNMTAKERQAVAEVLESYFTPDSPEGLACAMYQLKRIYETQKPPTPKHHELQENDKT